MILLSLLLSLNFAFAQAPAKPNYQGAVVEDWRNREGGGYIGHDIYTYGGGSGGGSTGMYPVGGPRHDAAGVSEFMRRDRARKQAIDAYNEASRKKGEQVREEGRRIDQEEQRKRNEWHAEYMRNLPARLAQRDRDWAELRASHHQIEAHSDDIRRRNLVLPGRERAYYAGTNFLNLSKTSFENDVRMERVENGLEYYQGLNKIALSLLDISIGLNPVTGLGQSGYEFFIGKNLVTGEKLSNFERSIAFAGILSAGGIPKIHKITVKLWDIINRYQKTYAIANKFKNADHINKVVTQGAHIAKALEEVKAGKPITQTIGDFPPEQLNQMIEHIEVLNDIRKAYVKELAEAAKQIEPLAIAGQSLKRIAEWANQMRRQIGIKYKELTPEPFRTMIYERNLGKPEYKDPFGKTFEKMYEESKLKGLKDEEIYEKIIHSAFRPNAGLSSFLEEASKILGK